MINKEPLENRKILKEKKVNNKSHKRRNSIIGTIITFLLICATFVATNSINLITNEIANTGKTATNGVFIKRVFIASTRDRVSTKTDDYGAIEVHVVTNDNQDLGDVGTVKFSQTSNDGGQINFNGNRFTGTSLGTVTITATVEYAGDTVISNSVQVIVQEDYEIAYRNATLFKYNADELFNYGGRVTSTANQGIYFTNGAETVTIDGTEFEASDWNVWTKNADPVQNPDKPYEGIAQNELDSEGNIQFNVEDNGIFNENIAEGKDSYTNVGIPFVKQGNGFYKFDSNAHEAYFENGQPQSDVNLQWKEDKVYYRGDAGTYIQGFFPFNNPEDMDNDEAVYHFGMKISTPFYMTEDGVTGTGEDIVFEFSGDDDIWIFIDGKLVIDLGGIHNQISADINFADNEVIVYEGLKSNGVINKQTALTDILGADWNDSLAEEHTLSVFYLERGKGSSNCQVYFNLPTSVQMSDVLVHHYLEGTYQKLAPDEVIEGFPGDSYTTSQSDQIPQNYEFASVTGETSGLIGTTRTTVNYYYRLKTPSITDVTVNKTSSLQEITNINQQIPYHINYTANITDYIGDSTITIVDYLPYSIDTGSSDLDGGSYSSTNNTITWTENLDINTYQNQNSSINISKDISLKYLNIDTTKQTLSNTAYVTINLTNPQVANTDYSSLDLGTNYTQDITVQKIWNDNNNTAQKRPSSITLILNGSDSSTHTQLLNTSNEISTNVWEYTFENLPKYESDGREIEYTLSEQENGEENNKFYQTSINQQNKTVTNTFEVPDEKINVTVTKIWNHTNNVYKKPTTIKVQVKGNGNVYEQQITDAQEVAENTWEYTFEELPKYDALGNIIQYSVDEEEVTPGDLDYYQKDILGNTITNTYIGPVISSTKTVSPQPAEGYVLEGQTLTYTITVKNDGNLAKDVIIKDTIPDGTTFVQGSIKENDVAKSEYNQESLINGITVNVPEKGQTTLSFEVIVKELQQEEFTKTITNTASVDGKNTNTTNTTVNKPFLEFKKLSSPANNTNVIEGTEITYTIELKNTKGTAPATVNVKDTIPEGTEYVEDTIRVDGVDLGYNISDLTQGMKINVDAHSTRNVTFTVKVKDLENGKTIKNQAFIDNIPTNEVIHTYIKSIISAKKEFQTQKDLTYVMEGEKITYTVTVSNDGDLEKRVLVKDNVPEGTHLVTGSVKVDNKETSYTKQQLKNGIYVDVDGKTKVPVTFEVIVDKDGTEITNKANVDGNDTNEVSIPVVTYEKIAEVQRQTAEEIEEGQVTASDRIVYTIIIQNLGTETINNIIVKDTIPEGTTISRINNGGNPDIDKEITWVVSNLQGEQTAKVSFEVTVDYDVIQTKTITNIATVDNYETNEVENTYIKPEIKLENTLSKTGPEKITSTEETLTYNLSYNATIDDFVGQGTVTIIDKLPYPIDQDLSDLDGGTYNNTDQTITWVEELENIDTYLNNTKIISIPKEITVKYIYADEENLTGTMTNNITSKIELKQNREIVKKDEQTDSSTTSIEIPAKITVHHYIYDEESGGNTTIKIAEDEVATGIIGDKYTTKKAEVRADYEVISETPEKYEGKLTKSETVVTYYYQLKQASINSTIQKESLVPVLTTEDGLITYKITYNVTVQNYLGKLSINLTDTLPYKINTENYELAGGTYSDETNTITWTEQRDINTFINGEFTESIVKEFTIAYINQDVTKPIVNTATGHMEIYYPEIHSTKPGEIRLEETKETQAEVTQDYRVTRKVEKVWDDNEDVKGRRPDSVTVELTADGSTSYNEQELETVILDKENNWMYTFEGLPKYTETGEIISYSVVETETNPDDLEYYEEAVIETFGENIKVTNKYKLMNIELDSHIEKTGTELITSSSQEVDYNITYKVTVNDYIGQAVVTIVDNLPYEINEELSDLNEGIYDAQTHTITWKQTIDHINTFENGDYYFETAKQIKVVYNNLDATQRTVINNVKATIDLYETETTNTRKASFETKSEVPGTVTVKYIDKDSGEEITYEEQNEDGITIEKTYGYEITGLAGDNYTTEQKDIYGYTFIEDTNNTQGNMIEGQIGVVYYYVRTDSQGVIVKYVDDQGNEIAPQETITGKVMDLYQTVKKDIENYDFVRVEGETQGELVEDVIEVTYIYTKIPGRVIVQHLEKDDTPEDNTDNIVLSPEEIIEGFSGDRYETQRQEIANYKDAEPEPENATGTMTRGDIYVTYYYERKTSGIITVKYVDIDTNEEILYKDAENGDYLPYREQLQGLCGLKYEVEQKEISYYNLVKDQIPENSSGIYTEDDLEIIFYYKKQEFNLKVEKQITKITVNGQEHSLNEELDQIDVVSSKVLQTNIEVTYKIIVSNTAEIEGTATIVENIPEYFSVVEDGSKGWNTVDGTLQTTVTLQPGETKELNVLLRWKKNSNNFGLQTNEVTLKNISNPANFAESTLEDNKATAEVMLSVKTGGTDTQVYIILDFGLSFIILIGNIMLLGTRSKNSLNK